MLDFTSDIADDGSSSRATEHAPDNDQALLDAYSNAVIGVTERVGPAVVRVETGPKVRNARERGGLGSGIVISPDGLVLTNSHVVGSSKEIRLRDTEGFVTDAHVLGVDPDTDLALAARRRRARFALCLARQFQEPAPRPARGRDRQSAGLRIDGDRRRGVGAGPFDPLGERPDHRGRDPDRCRAQSRQFRRAAGVVGGGGDRHQHRDHQGAQGICFAVASNTAQFVLSEIIRHGYVRRAYIGVSGQTAPIPRRHAVVAGVDNTMGALLAQIEPDGPAAQAGLLPGDVVIKLDGVEINGVDDLIRALDRDRIDRKLEMDVLRMGRLRAIDIHPVERKRAARQ